MRWIDRSPVAGAQYWLEDVDLNGARSMHGPIAVSSGPASPQAFARVAIGNSAALTVASTVCPRVQHPRSRSCSCAAAHRNHPQHRIPTRRRSRSKSLRGPRRLVSHHPATTGRCRTQPCRESQHPASLRRRRRAADSNHWRLNLVRSASRHRVLRHRHRHALLRSACVLARLRRRPRTQDLRRSSRWKFWPATAELHPDRGTERPHYLFCGSVAR